jgi:hypothetical protein
MPRRLACLFALALFIAAGCSTPQGPAGAAALRPDEPCTRPELSAAESQDALGVRHFGVYIDGQRAGRLDETLSHEAGGPYVCRTAEKSTVVYGGDRDEAAAEHTWVFSGDAPHALLRAESSHSSGKGPRKERLLEKGAAGWQLTTRRGGTVHVKPVPAPDYTFEDFVASDVWLARPHQAGDAVVVHSLSLKEGKVRPVRYRVLSASGAAGDWSYEETDVEGNHSLGRREGRDHSEVRLGCWELRQEAAADDRPAAARLEGRVKVGQRLGDVRTIEELRLRATGPAAARLESGPGQTVARGADGRVTVTLSASAPAVKAAADEIAAGLEDSFEHPHRDPAVRALLNRALGGRKLSRRQTAEELIQFLQGYLTYDADAEPESVVALIRTRRGVCRHFADLLTTLLRAADIPARSASGLACGGGAEFGGHRWTELVLEDGTWLGVDPTFGQMRTTAHVRLPDNEEGRLVLLELDHLNLDIEQASRTGWGGWWWLVAGAGGVVVLVIAVKVIRRARGRSAGAAGW